MNTETFDRASWERRWTQVLRDHPDKVAARQPSADLLAEAAHLSSGLALDAGCGHGAESLWLAAQGWLVTAVDFSPTALGHARETARSLGTDIADRIEWKEADLGIWKPQPRRYNLVICLYVHVAGSVQDMVGRLASGVARGGTLLLIGHQPVDPATGAPTPAAGQVQVSIDAALDALDPQEWRIEVAQERPRAAAGSGVDAVVRAVLTS